MASTISKHQTKRQTNQFSHNKIIYTSQELNYNNYPYMFRYGHSTGEIEITGRSRYVRHSTGVIEILGRSEFVSRSQKTKMTTLKTQ